MINWVKKKFYGMMIALHWTENSLKASSDDLVLGEGQYQSHKQGMLSHSLINGEVTQEVKELRWRLYKVLKHSNMVETKIIGYDENNMPITETKKKESYHKRMNDYKTDSEDDEFKLVLIQPNESVELSNLDILNQLDGDNKITKDDHLNSIKNKKTIMITRDFRPTINIEDYTNKILLREIDNDKCLVEFHISKYIGEYKRKRFLISEIKKMIGGRVRNPIIDFDKIFFITNNALGFENDLEFELEMIKFHRVIEYDGNYIIKFICKKNVYGEYIFEKYRLSDLDEKYEKKLRK